MNRSAEPRHTIPIQVIIFLAGFSFLVAEVGWNRQLALTLGSTVTAATLVLATFMAGFGVGAFFWGRLADGRKRIGSWLALLLAGIGVSNAVGFGLVSHAAPHLLVAVGLLFVPAWLMGGVFPLVSKIGVGPGQDVAPVLGRLYALETLGSAVGGLLTGFVFLGALGQQNTMILAVVINLILAGWLVATRRYDDIQPLPIEDQPAPAGPARAESRRSRREGIAAAGPDALRQTALVGAFVCGLVMLALQVLWLRIFRIYLTNSSYTFALVSSLVILGLFAGSKLFERRGGRLENPPLTMVRALVLLAGLAGLGLVLLIDLPELLMFPFQSLFSSPLARVLLLPVVASLLVVFPPAMVSGFVFPLACSMYAAGRGAVSRDVGLVLMVNTAGSALGPVVAAFVLLPWLGAAQAVLLVILVAVIGAVLILARWRPRGVTVWGRNIFAAIAVVLVVVLVAGPQIRILPPSFSRYDRDLLFYLESVEGTLAVGRDRATRAQALHTYVNNSAVIGSTYDAIKVVKMVGHFPFFLGLEGGDVLVIGFGIGVTASAIAAHPGVESIECVELVPGLRDAAVFYRDVNRDIVADPRLEIIAGDGRLYLQRTQKTYDLISCDPTHPILGSGNLYTRDYFEMCRAHLNPGGMVSQYLPLHKLRTEEFLGIIRTFESVFPECTVWLGHYHAVLLGALQPIEVDFVEWTERIDEMERDAHFLLDPYHLAATLVLDGAAIADLGATSRINTDDRSYTEFFAPACLDEDNLIRNLRFLQEHRIKLGAVFTNVADSTALSRYVRGNELLTKSLIYQFAGDSRSSLSTLREACEAAPDDQEFPFLIKLYF